MTTRILVLGGYGNFGRFISKALAENENITVIIAGRSKDKAKTLVSNISAANKVEIAELDINVGFTERLIEINPDVVVHTSGPFQSQGYDIAEACIEYGCHYIDLADGREFVSNVISLDKKAKSNNVTVISGASSVPCLTSALLDDYQTQFKEIHSVEYGITTAQKTARGLATTAAILGYTGKPFTTIVEGKAENIFGWQGLKSRVFNQLGRRYLGYCDIPDMELFPDRYPTLKTLKFYAGLEIPFIHFTLWGLSWLVRIGLIRRLEKAASLLLRTSYMFDWLGTSNSAFFMDLEGIDNGGNRKTEHFELTARSGDGPYIPCMPAILLAKRLASKQMVEPGAYPCVGYITKDDYLNALKTMDISWTHKN